MEVDFVKRDLNLSQIQQEIKSKKSLIISKKKKFRRQTPNERIFIGCKG
jgi:hypothetical protein